MSETLDAFRREAQSLTDAAATFSEDEWHAPTRCEPWTVRELLGHVRVAIAWLPDMLAAAPPPRAEISAAEYYRPDARFSSRTNATRVDLARAHAAGYPTGAALLRDFTTVWRKADRLCRAEPSSRVVITRHGDPILLSEFLVTRVLELAVHGLDLADAIGREPWLTPSAAEVVHRLLPGSPSRPDAGFLRKATGRAPLTADEEALGIRRLTLG
ncbi:maleylpyruvate isomerase family mycothiol-dependent enzyme [Paractinoplanes atraurantiacus]|uniref:TIGR03083 family protein n=1 Tax=Paractinoplanes atraurantiacus TaxID=1036182 RepID=A0A285K2Y8_9ACTN|nr:maleylpyruvate isomerase family mycothiol-dependent enzyme [Actinoplanes atraurantiacus]SNY66387.1 TIGR03083 family protein [Actinoplanes atraurantiacus]